MMKSIRKHLREERGSQLLEFILTMPLLLILITFVFDQFTILYNKQRALSAAYKAGRIAAVQPNQGLAEYHGEERGMEELKQCIALQKATISISNPTTWAKGKHFEARAKISFRLLWSDEPYELRESYHMMIENGE